MKWYFAARMRHQPMLCEIAEKLKEKGEVVSSSWLYASSLKPYEENIEAAGVLAQQELQEVAAADIFILITDNEGTDTFVELGYAYAVKTHINQSMKIYLVGEHNKRSLMHLHPAAQHIESLEEIFEQEKISFN